MDDCSFLWFVLRVIGIGLFAFAFVWFTFIGTVYALVREIGQPTKEE